MIAISSSFITHSTFKVVLYCVFTAISHANCTHGWYKRTDSSEGGNLATNPKIAASENMREGAMFNQINM